MPDSMMKTLWNFSNTSLHNMNSSNVTDFPTMHENPEYLREHWQNILTSLSTILIALTAFVGNLAVISLYFLEENLKIEASCILTTFLASIDVITSIIVMLPSAIALAFDFWPFGSIICKINGVFNYSCACSSSYTAAMISLDRAIAVVYPLRYKTWITKKSMTIFCIWVLINTGICAVLCSILNDIVYNYLEMVCAVNYINDNATLFFQGAAFLCYWVPASVMIVSNALIIREVKNLNKVLPSSLAENNILKRNNFSGMKKSIYSMMAIVCVYFICFTPYTLNKQFKYHFSSDLPPWYNLSTTVLIFSSSATNLFIYGILRKDYRNGFRKLYRKLKEKIHCSV